MRRRVISLTLAVMALVGAFAVAPASAYTSPGLQCLVLKVWSEGSGHGGLPKYGVSVGLYNDRSSGVRMHATLLDGTGKTLTTWRLWVAAHSSRTTTVTANSPQVSVTNCTAS